MKKATESSMEIEETRSYMDLSFSRAPKKNHTAIAKNLKQLVPWFKEYGLRSKANASRTDITDSRDIPAINTPHMWGIKEKC